MRTILVSGASGIVGYGILRSLRMSDTPYTLIGTSIYDDSVAPAFCDVFELAPRTDDPAYMSWLLSIIKKYRVDMIMPGIEADMHKWVMHLPAIHDSGAVPLINTPGLVTLCADKWAFYEQLQTLGIPCVIDSTLDNNFDRLQSRFGVPFLIKPRRGFGSKGIYRIPDKAAFLPHQNSMGSIMMAQPIVGTADDEYTISVFGDGQGNFYAGMTLRRKLSADGYTDKASVADTKPFHHILTALCQHFKPVGPTNFQFRTQGGEIKLLEINPRISSSTAIRSAFGYNESVMAVEFFLTHHIPSQPVIRYGKAVRYTDEHIFYDDSIHF
jgi:carbamoyl-phosphate synthase large subunit